MGEVQRRIERAEINREKKWKELIGNLEKDVFVRSQLKMANSNITLATEKRIEIYEIVFIGETEEELPKNNPEGVRDFEPLSITAGELEEALKKDLRTGWSTARDRGSNRRRKRSLLQEAVRIPNGSERIPRRLYEGKVGSDREAKGKAGKINKI